MKASIIIIFDIIICFLLYVSAIDFSNIKILDDDFLITFMISIVGIFLAIITLMYGLIEQIRKIFKESNIEQSIKKIYKSFDEIKENTMLIVYIMIFIFILSITLNIDIPFISQAYINKKRLYLDLKIFGLILVLVSIYDTVKTFFLILKISRFDEK